MTLKALETATESPEVSAVANYYGKFYSITYREKRGIMGLFNHEIMHTCIKNDNKHEIYDVLRQ